MGHVRWCEMVLTSSSDIWCPIQDRDAAIPQYAHTSCLQLATSVAKLPQELRDMIYDSVLDSEIQHRIEVRFCDENRSHSRPTKYHPLPHVLDAGFLGLEVASELAQRFADIFRRKPWCMTLIQLSETELTDVRCLGLPFTTLVRGVQIEVSFSRVRRAVLQILGRSVFSDLSKSDWISSRKLLLVSLVTKVKLLVEALGSSGFIKIIQICSFRAYSRLTRLGVAQYDSFVEDLFKELEAGVWDQVLRYRADA
jgi:hypothetical protein